MTLPVSSAYSPLPNPVMLFIMLFFFLLSVFYYFRFNVNGFSAGDLILFECFFFGPFGFFLSCALRFSFIEFGVGVYDLENYINDCKKYY